MAYGIIFLPNRNELKLFSVRVVLEMKKYFITIIVFLCLNPAFSAVSNNGVAAGSFGIGFEAGNPTGLSMKYWLDNITAVDSLIAWSFSSEKNSYFHLSSDYLYHFFGILDTKGIPIPLYCGGGLRFGYGEKISENGKDYKLGLRLPVGIEFIISNIPIDIFVEIAPIFDVIPKTDFDLNGGLGARYFF